MRFVELNEGVNLYLDNTDKFKNTRVIVTFSKELEDDSVYWNALTYMLEDKCNLYDSKKKVTAKLDEMYGAKFSVRCNNRGNLTNVSFKCSAISEKYVDDNMFESQIELLKNFIYNPIIYREEAIDLMNEAKMMIESELYYIKDNPRSLANREASDMYFDYIGYPKLLDVEDLAKLNIDIIRSKYEYMINDMSMNIFVSGNIDEDKAIAIIKDKLVCGARSKRINTGVVVEYNGVVEKQQDKKINQSNIILTYKTSYKLNRDDYCILIVLDGLLGSLSTSLLFQEVREKNSLCYSIYSSHSDFSGIVNVDTSCSKGKEEVVVEMIDKQISRIQQGDFEDDLIDKTKIAILTNMRKKLDLPTTNLSNMSLMASFGDMFDNFKVMERIKTVTKEEVIELANSFQLIIKYVMKGTSDDHE